MKVLVVEDNARLAERITYKLSRDFTIDVAKSGEEALEQCRHVHYSVIVLDLGLPHMSGVDVCKELRRSKCTAPILILSGLNAIQTRVELLDNGADDYLTKPFDINELRARIRALQRRRAERTLGQKIICGALEIDNDRKEVTHGGTPISLRRKEFAILHYLTQNQGRILTRQMIMDNVWGNNSSSWISTIDVHIKHLRDKIDRPFGTSYIKTAYGLGYKVDADK